MLARAGTYAIEVSPRPETMQSRTGLRYVVKEVYEHQVDALKFQMNVYS